MAKLTALIEAAKVALVPDTDADMCRKGYVPNMLAYYKKADPTTILELCALLEKAEAALQSLASTINYQYTGSRESMTHLQRCDDKGQEALAAIKQWKEKT